MLDIPKAIKKGENEGINNLLDVTFKINPGLSQKGWTPETFRDNFYGMNGTQRADSAKKFAEVVQRRVAPKSTLQQVNDQFGVDKYAYDERNLVLNNIRKAGAALTRGAAGFLEFGAAAIEMDIRQDPHQDDSIADELRDFRLKSRNFRDRLDFGQVDYHTIDAWKKASTSDKLLTLIPTTIEEFANSAQYLLAKGAGNIFVIPSEINRIASDIARNDERELPNGHDMLQATPAALLNVAGFNYLRKLALGFRGKKKGKLGEKKGLNFLAEKPRGVKGVAKEAGKAFVKGGTTEAITETFEELTASAWTKRGIDEERLKDAAFAGAFLGGNLGGGSRAISASIEAIYRNDKIQKAVSDIEDIDNNPDLTDEQKAKAAEQAANNLGEGFSEAQQTVISLLKEIKAKKEQEGDEVNAETGNVQPDGQVENALTPDDIARYETLQQKEYDETITPDEQQELTDLQNRVPDIYNASEESGNTDGQPDTTTETQEGTSTDDNGNTGDNVDVITDSFTSGETDTLSVGIKNQSMERHGEGNILQPQEVNKGYKDIVLDYGNKQFYVDEVTDIQKEVSGIKITGTVDGKQVSFVLPQQNPPIIYQQAEGDYFFDIRHKGDKEAEAEAKEDEKAEQDSKNFATEVDERIAQGNDKSGDYDNDSTLKKLEGLGNNKEWTNIGKEKRDEVAKTIKVVKDKIAQAQADADAKAEADAQKAKDKEAKDKEAKDKETSTQTDKTGGSGKPATGKNTDTKPDKSFDDILKAEVRNPNEQFLYEVFALIIPEFQNVEGNETQLKFSDGKLTNLLRNNFEEARHSRVIVEKKYLSSWSKVFGDVVFSKAKGDTDTTFIQVENQTTDDFIKESKERAEKLIARQVELQSEIDNNQESTDDENPTENDDVSDEELDAETNTETGTGDKPETETDTDTGTKKPKASETETTKTETDTNEADDDTNKSDGKMFRPQDEARITQGEIENSNELELANLIEKKYGFVRVFPKDMLPEVKAIILALFPKSITRFSYGYENNPSYIGEGIISLNEHIRKVFPVETGTYEKGSGVYSKSYLKVISDDGYKEKYSHVSDSRSGGYKGEYKGSEKNNIHYFIHTLKTARLHDKSLSSKDSSTDIYRYDYKKSIKKLEEFALDYKKRVDVINDILLNAKTTKEVAKTFADYLITAKIKNNIKHHFSGRFHLSLEGVGWVEDENKTDLTRPIFEMERSPLYLESGNNLLDRFYAWEKIKPKERKINPRDRTAKKLTELIRTVPDGYADDRNGKPATYDLLKKVYGLGKYYEGNKNYVKNLKSLAVNLYYDGFGDLANAVGLAKNKIGLKRWNDGRLLGVGFATGNAGKGRAHYFYGGPQDGGRDHAISITRDNGNGTVAHEWSHAFDYGILKNPEYSKVREEILKVLKYVVNPDWKDEKYNELHGNLYFMGRRYTDDELSEWLIENKDNYTHWDRGRHKTSFLDSARSLDGGKVGNHYWQRDVELIARAMETWIYDKMKGLNITNEFLVDDTVEKKHMQGGYQVDIWPQGEERLLFNRMFDEIFDNLVENEDGILTLSDKYNLPKDLRDRIENPLHDYLKSIMDEARKKGGNIRDNLIQAEKREKADKKRKETEAKEKAEQAKEDKKASEQTSEQKRNIKALEGSTSIDGQSLGTENDVKGMAIANYLDSLDSDNKNSESIFDENGDKQQTDVQYIDSNGKPTLAVLSSATAQSQARALSNLKAELGDLSDFLMKELDFTKEEVAELKQEQVEAFATAISKSNIGDIATIAFETGFGKGRFVGLLANWAIRNDMIPIIFTDNARLYDISYRDLLKTHIGRALEYKNKGRSAPIVLITNDNKDVQLSDDVILPKMSATDKKNQLARAKSGSESYDVIMTSYLQMQNQERFNFIKGLAKNSFIIFDESHMAGSDFTNESSISNKIHQISLEAKRAANSSATPWKDLQSLFRYAQHTKLGHSLGIRGVHDGEAVGEKIKDLISSLSENEESVFLEYLSSQMSENGDVLNAMETWDGVKVSTKLVTPQKELQDTLDVWSQVVSDLQKIHKTHLSPMLSQFNQPDGKGKVRYTSLVAQVHLLTDKLLVSQKINDAVNETIKQIKAGNKVVVAVSHTNNQLLEDVQKSGETDLEQGIRLVLLKEVNKIEVLLGKMSQGYIESEGKRHIDLDRKKKVLEELDALVKFIKKQDFSKLTISPLDAFREGIEKAGYNSAELTGRSLGIKKDKNGKGSFERIKPSETQEVAYKFNNLKNGDVGNIHALIINETAAKGIDLHASVDFKNQDKRVMLVVEGPSNVMTYLQIMGRTKRFNSVVKPEYVMFYSNDASEIKQAALINRHLSEMRATVSGDASGQGVQEQASLQMFNPIGDIVAREVLLNNTAFAQAMGFPRIYEDIIKEMEPMRKIFNRLSFFTFWQRNQIKTYLQNAYYNEISTSISETIGANGTLDLQAKKLFGININPNKDDKLISLWVDAKLTNRPMSIAEVITELNKSLGSNLDRKDIKDRSKQSGMLSSLEEKGKNKIDNKFIEIGKIVSDYESKNEKVEEADNGLKNFLRKLHPGSAARISRIVPGKYDSTERSAGIVLDVTSPSLPENYNSLNPAEQLSAIRILFRPSSWKIKIATSDSRRLINIPLSQTRDFARKNSQISTFIIGSIPLETAEVITSFHNYEALQTEERAIITGNLALLYKWRNSNANEGHIGYKIDFGDRLVRYTQDDGSINFGLLLQRGTIPQKSLKNLIVKDSANLPNILKKANKDIKGKGLEILGEMQIRTGNELSHHGFIRLNKDKTSYMFRQGNDETTIDNDKALIKFVDGEIKKYENIETSLIIYNYLSRSDVGFTELAKIVSGFEPQYSKEATELSEQTEIQDAISNVIEDIRTLTPADKKDKSNEASALDLSNANREQQRIDKLTSQAQYISSLEEIDVIFTNTLKHGVTGQSVKGITRTNADGRQIIEIALSGEPLNALHHESIHALKNLGLFTDAEWYALEHEAKKNDWITKFNIKQNYPELFDGNGTPNQKAVEESIADAFALWMHNPESLAKIGKPEMKSLLERIFEMMRKFFMAISARLLTEGTGVTSAFSVFSGIKRGEVGKRAKGSKNNLFTRNSPQYMKDYEQNKKVEADAIEQLKIVTEESAKQRAKRTLEEKGPELKLDADTLKEYLKHNLESPKEAWLWAWHNISRSNASLEENGENAFVNRAIRLARNALTGGTRAEVEHFMRMIYFGKSGKEPLSQKELDEVVSMSYVLRDMKWTAENINSLKLKFGIESEMQLNQMIEAHNQRFQPMDGDTDVVLKRKELLRERIGHFKELNEHVRQRLIDTGVYSANDLLNPFFWHNSVLKFAEFAHKNDLKRGQSAKRGKNHQRVGTDMDISMLMEDHIFHMEYQLRNAAMAEMFNTLRDSAENFESRFRQQGIQDNLIAVNEVLKSNPEKRKEWETAVSHVKEAAKKIGFAWLVLSPTQRLAMPKKFQNKMNAVVKGKITPDQRISLNNLAELAIKTPTSDSMVIAAHLLQRGLQEKHLVEQNILKGSEYKYINVNDASSLLSHYDPDGLKDLFQPATGEKRSLTFFNVETLNLNTIKALEANIDLLERLEKDGNKKISKMVIDQMKFQIQNQQEILAVGRPYQQMIVRKEVAQALRIFHDKRAETVVGEFVVSATNAWKGQILFVPWRAVPYNFNNIIGDIEILLGTGHFLGTFNKLGAAHNLLKRYYTHQKLTVEENELIQHAIKFKLIYGLTSTEILGIDKMHGGYSLPPEYKSLGLFKRALHGTSLYYNAIRNLSVHRENVTRLAFFLNAHEKIVKEGVNPITFGAGGARRAEMMATPELIEKATLITQGTMGDYADLPVAARWAKRYPVPFASWIFTNPARYFRVSQGTVWDYKNHPDLIKGGLKTRLAYGNAVLATRQAAIWGLRFYKLTLGIMLINWLFFPEEDKLLWKTPYRGHRLIISNKDEDGNFITISAASAFKDALSIYGGGYKMRWLMYEAYLGNANMTDVIAEFPKSIVNTGAQSFNPLLKGVVEVAMRTQTFPSLFEPRFMHDRLGYVAGIVGAKPILRRIQDATGGVQTAAPALEELGRYVAIHTNNSLLMQKYYDRSVKNLKDGPRLERIAELRYNFKKAIRSGDNRKAAEIQEKATENGVSIKTIKRWIKQARSN